jgi:hypothetical protein
VRRLAVLASIAAALIAVPAADAASAAPARGASLAPVYAASQGWLNGKVTRADTAGKVVVVDVFT